MTREEILAMGAGIELDALVVGKIIGAAPVTVFRPPPYSIDISYAWQVVEKLKRTETWGDFCSALTELCLITHYDEGAEEYYIDDFLSNVNSEIVCKAALLAKLEDEWK